MLHLRRWISVVAALGMLAHAAALERHNNERHSLAMLGAAGTLTKLSADLARICHGGEDAGRAVDRVPSPADSQVNCAICARLGPAFIDVAAQKASLNRLLAPAPASPRLGARSEGLKLALRPPVRGPPAPLP
ncbi:MAG TPA: hypothetical protein VN523_14425 [Hyphomicrobiaceae bacterium]|nr:hypothetical protein [Hyphomicrobiaceae bacterium]